MATTGMKELLHSMGDLQFIEFIKNEKKNAEALQDENSTYYSAVFAECVERLRSTLPKEPRRYWLSRGERPKNGAYGVLGVYYSNEDDNYDVIFACYVDGKFVSQRDGGYHLPTDCQWFIEIPPK